MNDRLTFYTIWIKLFFVCTFGQRSNTGCAPRPIRLLHLDQKVFQSIFRWNELAIVIASVIVLAIDPVRMHSPIGVLKKRWNWKTSWISWNLWVLKILRICFYRWIWPMEPQSFLQRDTFRNLVGVQFQEKTEYSPTDGRNNPWFSLLLVSKWWKHNEIKICKTIFKLVIFLPYHQNVVSPSGNFDLWSG